MAKVKLYMTTIKPKITHYDRLVGLVVSMSDF